MTEHEPVEAMILDDTGFLKQGKHSVGVQRQYTGSAGKVTNCQIGVSLTLATRTEHLPIDFALYLPRCWADDLDKRREGRIPDHVSFKTKPELGLQLLESALAEGMPKGVVLADAAYGTSTKFRAELRRLRLDYAVAVNSTTKVQLVKSGKTQNKVQSLKSLARDLDKKDAFRRCTWRQGTHRLLAARFVRRRVMVSDDEVVELLIEWRYGEIEPANYFFVSMPKIESTKKLVRLVMQRWRTERAYEDLKGELGLDHYEGRRFPGWQHHVSVVLSCYAFFVAERARSFPPSPTKIMDDNTLGSSAGAPLRRQLHHSPAHFLTRNRQLAPEVSRVPPAGPTAVTQ